MPTMNRPTTTTAVDADLRARADFRGIEPHAQVHYLLGMCSALLAEANATIVRLEKRLADEEHKHDGDCECEARSWERAADAAMETER